MIGAVGREQALDQLAHLLRHLERRHPVVDQRLVDEDVEEAHLGLGDPAHRLRVDADQLEQRDQREAGVEDALEDLDRLEVVVGEPIGGGHRHAEQGHHPLDQLIVEADLGRGLAAAAAALDRRQQVLDVAEGEAPVANRSADLTQRVAAIAHPGDDPGLGRGGRRPAPVLDRDDAIGGPALQGRLRDAGPARRLGQRDPLGAGAHRRAPRRPAASRGADGGAGSPPANASPDMETTGSVRPRRPYGLTARSVGLRRSSRLAPCEDRTGRTRGTTAQH